MQMGYADDETASSDGVYSFTQVDIQRFILSMTTNRQQGHLATCMRIQPSGLWNMGPMPFSFC